VFSNPEALTRKYTLTIVDVCPEVVGGEWPLKSEIVPTILQLDEILVIPISDLL
jgi:hypothetical protein